MYTCSAVSDSLQPHGLWPTRLLCPGDFPDKNTGVGSHFLLQWIFHPGIDPTSSASSVLAGSFLTTLATWEALILHLF